MLFDYKYYNFTPTEELLTKEEFDRFKEYSEAVEMNEPIGLSPERIRAYELYLDNIRCYISNLFDAWIESFEEGHKKSYEESYKKGFEEGCKEVLALVKTESIDNIINNYTTVNAIQK
ncbi:MAG: hypothetical protein ACK5AO_05055 [bacterium]|jgi:flagellar biosynthesis/type III secretory pathway protein FliH